MIAGASPGLVVGGDLRRAMSVDLELFHPLGFISNLNVMWSGQKNKIGKQCLH